MNDDAILALLTRLARPHSSGGQVVERAAIVAAGADASAVEEWILDHSGTPEEAASTAPRRGLHGARLNQVAGTNRAPQRFVLPAGVLSGETARPAATISNTGRT
jgi:hypothetical protein